MPLANAGAARQDIDLIWGATLTRSVSMATRRFGSNFLSVGRVQSPTLGLIVQRELERRAHEPEFPSGRSPPTSPTPTAASSPSTPPTSSGMRPRPRRRSPTRRARARSRRSAPRRTPASRRPRSTPPPSPPTSPAGSASRPRGRCGSPRTSTWTATSPTRGPTTPSTRSRSTPRSWSSELVAVDDFKAAEFLVDGRSLEADPRQEGDDRPPADLSDAGGQPEASRGALARPTAGSMSWSPAASSPPSRRR